MKTQSEQQVTEYQEDNTLDRLLEGDHIPQELLKSTVDSIECFFKRAPAIAEAEFQDQVFLKCDLQSKAWFEMNSYLLQRGYESKAREVHSIVFYNARLATKTVIKTEGNGCGIIQGRQPYVIGYAHGTVVKNHHFNPGKVPMPVKWDRKSQKFMVDGRAITGAEVMILDANCKAVVINPTYAPE